VRKLMKLQLNATSEEVMRAVDSLCAFGRQLGLDERELFRLAIILEECASNIVKHGLHSDPEQKFSVLIDTELSIELRDQGPEFDPTRVVENRQQEIERSGGWGLDLVRHYSDHMHYRRDQGENVMRLTKKLGKSSPRHPFPDSAIP
jgi:anti-sigma regulatory factor (Ser/Thr protein kinase)